MKKKNLLLTRNRNIGILLFLLFFLPVFPALQAQDDVSTVRGTVFPFVDSGDSEFRQLFTIKAELYLRPDGIDNDPVEEIINGTPEFSTDVVYYNGSVFVRNTPVNPGRLGSTNVAGVEINWRAQPIEIVDNTPVAGTGFVPAPDSNYPDNRVGVFTFDGVPSGEYVLVISRPGFLTRFAQISVTAGCDLVVGHRFLIPGDADGNYEVNSHDLSKINVQMEYSYPDAGYNAKYDLNADGTVDIEDYNLAMFYLNMGFLRYRDTNSWVMTYY